MAMRLLAVLALLVGLAGAARAEPLRFVAFGDMPYCDPRNPGACPAEVARVAALVARINAARPAFSIFLGDTKGGAEHCTDAIILERTAAWFGLIEGPLVYTPGDNEWTDCWQPRGGGYDPLERLQRLREGFFARPFSLGRAPMPLQRQADLFPAFARYVENARWLAGNILFLTVHVPGSDNNRPQGGVGDIPPGAAAEFPARDLANKDWLREGFSLAVRAGHQAVVVALQADLFRCGRGASPGHLGTLQALAEGARRFGRPVLLLHGDNHFFLADQPMPEAPNLTRLMVPGAADTRAMLVTLDPGATRPFRFELIGPDDRPARPVC